MDFSPLVKLRNVEAHGRNIIFPINDCSTSLYHLPQPQEVKIYLPYKCDSSWFLDRSLPFTPATRGENLSSLQKWVQLISRPVSPICTSHKKWNFVYPANVWVQLISRPVSPICPSHKGWNFIWPANALVQLISRPVSTICTSHNRWNFIYPANVQVQLIAQPVSPTCASHKRWKFINPANVWVDPA